MSPQDTLDKLCLRCRPIYIASNRWLSVSSFFAGVIVGVAVGIMLVTWRAGGS